MASLVEVLALLELAFLLLQIVWMEVDRVFWVVATVCVEETWVLATMCVCGMVGLMVVVVTLGVVVVRFEVVIEVVLVIGAMVDL